jgi:hypothetical protein
MPVLGGAHVRTGVTFVVVLYYSSDVRQCFANDINIQCDKDVCLSGSGCLKLL